MADMTKKLKIKIPVEQAMLMPGWFENWFSRIFGNKEVFSPMEVAKKLDRPPQVVYRAIKSGELEAFILGKQTYIIPRPALERWLQQNHSLIKDE